MNFYKNQPLASNKPLASNNEKWNYLQSILTSLIALTLVFVGANLNAQTTTVTFKPNATNGNDAYVQNVNGCNPGTPFDSYDDMNFGNSITIRTAAWTYNNTSGCASSGTSGSIRSYIRFDDLNSLPVNVVINNATLKLYGVTQSDIYPEYGNTKHPGVNSPYKPNPIKIGLAQSSWNESVITWNNRPTINFSDGITHPASETRFDDTIMVDVTHLVQTQVSSGNNFGYGIQLQTEAKYRSWYWASSDHQTASRHPELIVTYSVPCNANFSYCYNTESMKFSFTPNSTNGGQYSWNFGDSPNTAITMGPSTVTHSYSEPGSYFVCLDAGKCKYCLKICVTFNQVKHTPQPRNQDNNSSSTGDSSISIDKLYPNPTTDNFTLEIDAKKSGNGKLMVHDMTGKKISEKSVSVIEGHQSVKHQFGNLSKGMYLCTLVIDGERASKSFVIE